MVRIYFHVNWADETDAEFLRAIRRQSPAGSARWQDVEAVSSPDAADVHVAFDQPAPGLDPDRTLLVCSEPPCNGICSGWEEVDALAKYPVEEYYKPQRWWVDRSYDELRSLAPLEKSRDLSWITTDKGRNLHPLLRAARTVAMTAGFRKFERKSVPLLDRGPNDGHILRMRFLDRLLDAEPGILDLYGRGAFGGPHYRGELDDKWDGLADYRYSLAVENYHGPNYFSEKLADAWLAWCMPVYWGCTNLDEFFPEESYVEVDIESRNAPQHIKEIVESDLRERNLDAIAEARRLLLEEYQIWPTIHRWVHERVHN